MMEQNYSVLMSVYDREKADYLKAAVESMLNQTVKTNDFVLVCDGKLNEKLDGVIEHFGEKYPGLFQIVRLSENHGLGYALNEGIKRCKNELVARMDSDDISLPDRCEQQIKIFSAQKEIDVVSGSVAEFESAIDQIRNIKSLPEKKEEIYQYARRRNPVNHPCVMYKKSRVLEAGGYIPFYYLEDYYLWLRMIEKNMNFYNLQRVLLYMRVNSGMYKRRGSLYYYRSILRLRIYMKRNGLSDWRDFLITVTGQLIVCLMPNRIREIFYRKALRREGR